MSGSDEVIMKISIVIGVLGGKAYSVQNGGGGLN